MPVPGQRADGSASAPVPGCACSTVGDRRPHMDRFLTIALRSLLGMASATTEIRRGAGPALRFHSALASQCFINEYVFSCTDGELTLAGDLTERLSRALEAGTDVSPFRILAVASYFPLFALENGTRLLETSWPPEVAAILRQQLSEPLEELRLRATIPRLTDIDDEVSVRVQDQYEENPYPRWIKAPRVEKAKDIEGYFRSIFPLAPIGPHEKRERTDILLCGCARVSTRSTRHTGSAGGSSAIDLSMSSLSYAKRKTQELGLASVTYAQPTC